MQAGPDTPAPDAAATRSRPGAALSAARQRAGLDQQRAAAEMRIDLATLRALESDDYARLGAPIFVKGHLRNYARLLGLDPEALVQEYEAATRPAPPQLVGYRNEGESVEGAPLRQHLPLFTWGIALLIVSGVALWAWNNPDLIRPADPIAAAPLGPVTAPAATDRAPAEPLVADPTAPSSDAEVTDTALPDTPPSASAAPAPVAEAPAPRATPPAADGALRVQLRFSGESWVEIYDAAGNPLVYELYEGGRSRSVTAQPPLRVFLGQAAAVTLSVDGRRVELGPLAKRDGTARFTLAAGGELR
jgi:cytoskeleton protein RodZ